MTTVARSVIGHLRDAVTALRSAEVLAAEVGPKELGECVRAAWVMLREVIVAIEDFQQPRLTPESQNETLFDLLMTYGKSSGNDGNNAGEFESRSPSETHFPAK